MRGDANDGDQDLSGVLAIPRVVAHADEDDTGLVVPRKDIDIVSHIACEVSLSWVM